MDGTLTAEHLQIMDEVRAEAMEVALATGPLDHDAVEASILRVYDLLGRDRPSVQWVGSPRVHLGGQLRGQLRGQLPGQLRGPLGAPRGATLRGTQLSHRRRGTPPQRFSSHP